MDLHKKMILLTELFCHEFKLMRTIIVYSLDARDETITYA